MTMAAPCRALLLLSLLGATPLAAQDATPPADAPAAANAPSADAPQSADPQAEAPPADTPTLAAASPETRSKSPIARSSRRGRRRPVHRAGKAHADATRVQSTATQPAPVQPGDAIVATPASNDAVPASAHAAASPEAASAAPTATKAGSTETPALVERPDDNTPAGAPSREAEPDATAPPADQRSGAEPIAIPHEGKTPPGSGRRNRGRAATKVKPSADAAPAAAAEEPSAAGKADRATSAPVDASPTVAPPADAARPAADAPPAATTDATPPADGENAVAAPATPPSDSATPAASAPGAPIQLPDSSLLGGAGSDASIPTLGANIPPPPVSRWPSLPHLVYVADYKPRELWYERIKALDGKDGCAFKPDAKGVVRLAIPFVVLFSGRGTIIDAHADRSDCPALAAIVEQFAKDLGPRQVVPPQGTPPLWRYSRFLAGWEQ